MPTGNGVLNFGGGTGSFEATFAVTGQTAIVATSHAEAFFMAEDTRVSNPPGADEDDHRVAAAQYQLTCTVPIAGTGFTVQALARGMTAIPLFGNYKFRWVWVT